MSACAHTARAAAGGSSTTSAAAAAALGRHAPAHAHHHPLARLATPARRPGPATTTPTTAPRATPGDDAKRLPPLPPLENETFDFCTDEACTISPAVAATARTLARDVSRGAPARPATGWTASAFQPGVRYTSDVRSFVGRDAYARCDWVGALLADEGARAEVAVTRLRMAGPAVAEICWRLGGPLRGLPGVEGGARLEADVVSTFTLDPITGRVAAHDDRISFDPSPVPVRLAASAARAAWAARRGAEDAASTGAKVLQTLASMDSDDDEGPGYTADPSDPTKFFQGGGGDGVMADAFMFAAVVALFWVLAQAWASLETVKF